MQEESHTFNEEETCTVCGNYFHTHKWQRTAANDYFHTVVCTGCGESQTVTHIMSGDICTVCGYQTHTHIMQYVGGTAYASEHETKCTSCDAISWEEHTYGSDDKCTVCGAERPCDHQWVANGEQHYDQHLLVCACGLTWHEPHSWTWNAEGNYAICTICGTKEHWHKYIAPDGTQCIECGYDKGTVGSQTQPNETKPAETEPAQTEPIETEPAETEPIQTEPIETEPAETEAAQTEPIETEPAETEPAQAEPIETELVETKPTETNPAEGTSGETNPAETEPEASETIDEEDGNVDSQSNGSTSAWVVAVVSVAALAAGLFLWKKKSA